MAAISWLEIAIFTLHQLSFQSHKVDLGYCLYMESLLNKHFSTSVALSIVMQLIYSWKYCNWLGSNSQPLDCKLSALPLSHVTCWYMYMSLCSPNNLHLTSYLLYGECCQYKEFSLDSKYNVCIQISNECTGS